MKTENYIENALKTESLNLESLRSRLSDEKVIRGLHSALGMVTEAGELADVFKKHIFYGKPIDWVNVEEELGDLFWYVAVMVDVLGKESFDSILQKNVDKLAKRYKDQTFTEASALHRDLSGEREILESNN
jgi:NTP pyrophosphatase (non-canonical NTP hydrolase)